MPVQIGAATHKQPSNPSNILGTSKPIQQFSIPHIYEKAIASSLHVASKMRWNHIFLSTESTGGSTTEGEEVVEDLCSETKRNTAQNESLGESPLATVSLSGNFEGRTSPVHQVAGHDLPQPVRFYNVTFNVLDASCVI